jgi:propionyl-CoA synthetase
VPMVYSAIIGILAINRLGAIHATVFGGFAPAALAQRIDASKPSAILTASCGIDGNKPPIAYCGLVRDAVAQAQWKPPKTVIWQREQVRWQVDRALGERPWQKLFKSAKSRGVKAGCVPVESGAPSYIIYTSGTTGLPKGVVRDTAGHAVGLHTSISYVFGIHGPGDVVSPDSFPRTSCFQHLTYSALLANIANRWVRIPRWAIGLAKASLKTITAVMIHFIMARRQY